MNLLIEREEAGVLDIGRAGDPFALQIPAHIPLLSIPVGLRMALEVVILHFGPARQAGIAPGFLSYSPIYQDAMELGSTLDIY